MRLFEEDEEEEGVWQEASGTFYNDGDGKRILN
jgi:hypothetical protein